MTEARNHHYVPQCYLKGFARGRGKKSKLIVYDYSGRRQFDSNPRNVCSERDFNRIDVEGYDPNHIESKYSQIESDISRSLQAIENKNKLDGGDRDNICYLMAMMAARSPAMRENWRKFGEKIAKQIMQLNVQSKDRWESSILQANIKDDVGYEVSRDFIERDQFNIELAKEHHIEIEMKATDTIFDRLVSRSWKTIMATDYTGPFITSDLPVNLIWEDVENNPRLQHRSPGFGLEGTLVVFSVSKSMAIIGSFEGQDGAGVSDSLSVANINSIIMNQFDRYFFSVSKKFQYLTNDNSISKGDSAFDFIDATRRALAQ